MKVFGGGKLMEEKTIESKLEEFPEKEFSDLQIALKRLRKAFNRIK